jgi:hypothetical protein
VSGELAIGNMQLATIHKIAGVPTNKTGGQLLAYNTQALQVIQD